MRQVLVARQPGRWSVLPIDEILGRGNSRIWLATPRRVICPTIHEYSLAVTKEGRCEIVGEHLSPSAYSTTIVEAVDIGSPSRGVAGSNRARFNDTVRIEGWQVSSTGFALAVVADFLSWGLDPNQHWEVVRQLSDIDFSATSTMRYAFYSGDPSGYRAMLRAELREMEGLHSSPVVRRMPGGRWLIEVQAWEVRTGDLASVSAAVEADGALSSFSGMVIRKRVGSWGNTNFDRRGVLLP